MRSRDSYVVSISCWRKFAEIFHLADNLYEVDLGFQPCLIFVNDVKAGEGLHFDVTWVPTARSVPVTEFSNREKLAKLCEDPYCLRHWATNRGTRFAWSRSEA